MANSKRIVTGSTEAIVDVLGILLLRPKKPFKGSFSKPPPGVAHPLAVGDGSETWAVWTCATSRCEVFSRCHDRKELNSKADLIRGTAGQPVLRGLGVEVVLDDSQHPPGPRTAFVQSIRTHPAAWSRLQWHMCPRRCSRTAWVCSWHLRLRALLQMARRCGTEEEKCIEKH